MANPNSYDDYGGSIRKQVLKLLDEDPSLRPKMLCRLLHLDHKEYQQYVANLRSQYKSNHCFDSALNPHRRVFVWACVGSGRALALQNGWVASANRNGMMIFRNGLGSVHWYKGGSVRLYLRGRAQLARAKELFARAFGWLSSADLSKYLDVSLREESKHWVFDVGAPVPRFEIKKFTKSHGIRVFADGSHKTGVEVEESIPLGLSDRLNDINDKVDHLLQGGLTSQQLLRANLGLLQAKVREDRGEGVSSKKTSDKPELSREQTISGPLGFWRFPIVNAFLQNKREQVTVDRMNKDASRAPS